MRCLLKSPRGGRERDIGSRRVFSFRGFRMICCRLDGCRRNSTSRPPLFSPSAALLSIRRPSAPVHAYTERARRSLGCWPCWGCARSSLGWAPRFWGGGGRGAQRAQRGTIGRCFYQRRFQWAAVGARDPNPSRTPDGPLAVQVSHSPVRRRGASPVVCAVERRCAPGPGGGGSPRRLGWWTRRLLGAGAAPELPGVRVGTESDSEACLEADSEADSTRGRAGVARGARGVARRPAGPGARV